MGVESYLVLGSSQTNAAILIASGVELMLIESFEIGRLDFPNRDTLKSTHCFCLTRISRKFFVYFCRDRGKFAGKDGGASIRILWQNPRANISVKTIRHHESPFITATSHAGAASDAGAALGCRADAAGNGHGIERY